MLTLQEYECVGRVCMLYVGDTCIPSLWEYHYVEDTHRCVLGKQVSLRCKRTPTFKEYAQAGGPIWLF